MPPIISGRRAWSIQTFISWTARSPASIETPAPSYVAPVGRPPSAPSVMPPSLRVEGSTDRGSGPAESVSGAATGERCGESVGVDQRCHLQQVLAEELGLGQLHRV